MLQSVEQYIEHVINNLLPTMLEEVMRTIA